MLQDFRRCPQGSGDAPRHPIMPQISDNAPNFPRAFPPSIRSSLMDLKATTFFLWSIFKFCTLLTSKVLCMSFSRMYVDFISGSRPENKPICKTNGSFKMPAYKVQVRNIYVYSRSKLCFKFGSDLNF